MSLKLCANIALAICLIVVSYISLTPIPSGAPEISDKLAHFIVWFGTGIFCGFRPGKQMMILALIILSWSGVIEIIQPYFNRTASLDDFWANFAGIVVAISIAPTLHFALSSGKSLESASE